MLPETITKLLEDYKPLILTQYRKFHSYFHGYMDKQELMQTIEEIFIKLVMEYDQHYGVDFPFYIKKKLGYRVYHYVVKHLDILNNEKDFDEVYQENYEVEDAIEFIDNIESFNTNIKLGAKQKKLLEGIVLRHKTIKELAEEEGVKSTVLHTRMHFLIEKIKKANNTNNYTYQQQSIVRVPIITRVPIILNE